jgi:hypothetical protein
MKTAVGLWIDHRKAVIVVVSNSGEETRAIESHVDKQPGRLAGIRSRGLSGYSGGQRGLVSWIRQTGPVV